MSKLFNLARMTTGTTGTGTLTLGSAVSGFLSFADAGVVDGDVVDYAIQDGANSEHGYGVYTASGTTLTRNVTKSTNGGSAINLSGNAQVAVAPRAESIQVAPQTPGGRLTLVSAKPVMLNDGTSYLAKTTIYYTPYNNDYIPIYNGLTFEHKQFAELSQATTDSTKSPAAAAAEALYDMFVWNDAGTLRCTRGPNWSTSATITVTIASPAVVTWTAHPLHEGCAIIFSTTGALPTGITAGTIYYVGKGTTDNTFNIATSFANAVAGTFVNTSGTQSGTHTGTNKTKLRGTGAGTTELELVNGILVNKNAITNGPAARKGTYVGTVKTNGSSQIDFDYGGGGPTRARFYVWNMYNRIHHAAVIVDDTSSYTYSTFAYRIAHANLEMMVEGIVGWAEDSSQATHTAVCQTVAVTNAFMAVEVAANSTDNIAGSVGYVQTPGAWAVIIPVISAAVGAVGIGWNYFAAVETSDGSNANTFNVAGTNTLQGLAML